jgi:hypothetical protein
MKKILVSHILRKGNIIYIIEKQKKELDYNVLPKKV